MQIFKNGSYPNPNKMYAITSIEPLLSA